MRNFTKSLLTTATLFSILSLTACQENREENKNTEVIKTEPTAITITPVENSPEFPNAQLTVKSIKTEMVGLDSVKITFDYDVRNYELKNQTNDASSKGCANSKEGQHIHFILDNGPYSALYEPTHSFTVATNSEHYVMSFLSRSYHESLKNPEAGVLKHFSVDKQGKITELPKTHAAMLFYSRPKGDYLGKDTEKILLDFYVYNGTLGKDANVMANINGTKFDITKWQPYFIQNAPMGDLTITLELVDEHGKPWEGDNTTVTRTSRLAKEEPMQ